MKTPTLLVVLLLATLPLAGCVQNMRDLKERVGAAEQELEPATVDPLPEETNNTTVLRPPVARIGVFGSNGALVYKATFQADNETAPVYVKEGSNLTLTAADSETLEPGATLASYAWAVAGKTMEGRQVQVEVGEPALYPVQLTVTDSNGETDVQTMTLAVAPTPFEVKTTLTTGPIVGADGEGVPATLTHEVSDTVEEKKHKIVSVAVSSKGGTTCDTILTVAPPEGDAMGPQDSGGDETITFMDAPAGAYAITVSGFACAAPQGIPVEVVVTYLLLVEGLEGDGHGGHAH